MIFTIHFGGPPLFLETPIYTKCFFLLAKPGVQGWYERECSHVSLLLSAKWMTNLPFGIRLVWKISRPASKLCGAATFSNPDDRPCRGRCPPRHHQHPSSIDLRNKQAKKNGRTHHESLKRSKDLILVYYLLKTNKHNSHVKNLLNKWDRPLYSHPFFWNFRRPNPPSPRHLHQGHWSLTLVMTRFFPWFFSSTKTTF